MSFQLDDLVLVKAVSSSTELVPDIQLKDPEQYVGLIGRIDALPLSDFFPQYWHVSFGKQVAVIWGGQHTLVQNWTFKENQLELVYKG